MSTCGGSLRNSPPIIMGGVLMFRSERMRRTGARSTASGTSSPMQSWADCITGTHVSSFWKRQQLDNARLDLDRFARLAKTGAATNQQLDTSRALVAQFEASIKADQAMIDTAQVQLNYSNIRSPIEGRVGTRLVDAGNIVRATDSTGIVNIDQIHPIFVSFALPSDSLPQLRAGLKEGNIAVAALDSNEHDLDAGVLAVIDNQINSATGTINYKAKFDNAGDVLWPGQFVNIRIQLAIRHNVIVVPLTAVQYGPDGPYAFVVGSDHIVQKRVIKIGVLNKTTAIIDDGLQPGEQVVTDGQY